MIDFSRIPLEVKNLLVNILLLPFWYLAIYIFHPNLYQSNDFFIILSVCICLILISSLVTSIVFVNINKGKNHILNSTIVYSSVVFQIFILSVLIFLSYLFKVYFNEIFLFYGFVLTYFGILGVALLAEYLTSDKI